MGYCLDTFFSTYQTLVKPFVIRFLAYVRKCYQTVLVTTRQSGYLNQTGKVLIRTVLIWRIITRGLFPSAPTCLDPCGILITKISTISCQDSEIYSNKLAFYPLLNLTLPINFAQVENITNQVGNLVGDISAMLYHVINLEIHNKLPSILCILLSNVETIRKGKDCPSCNILPTKFATCLVICWPKYTSIM